MHTLDDRSALTEPRRGQSTDRAQELRTMLGARRATDAIRAEATEVRPDTNPHADHLVAETEALSNTIRTLEATLQQAQESVTEARGSLDLLRTEMSATRPCAPAPTAAPRRNEPHEENDEPRPLGWLFRADRS